MSEMNPVRYSSGEVPGHGTDGTQEPIAEHHSDAGEHTGGSFDGATIGETIITPGGDLAQGSGEAYTFPEVAEVQKSLDNGNETANGGSGRLDIVNDRAVTSFTIKERPVQSIALDYIGPGHFGRRLDFNPLITPEAITEKYAAGQQKFIEQYPSQDDGLRIGNIRNFIGRLGLRNAPLVIRTESEKAKSLP